VFTGVIPQATERFWSCKSPVPIRNYVSNNGGKNISQNASVTSPRSFLPGFYTPCGFSDSFVDVSVSKKFMMLLIYCLNFMTSPDIWIVFRFTSFLYLVDGTTLLF